MTRRLSITEFLDEFPDDDSFLEWWRNACDERRKLLRLDDKAAADLDAREVYGLLSTAMHRKSRGSSHLLSSPQMGHSPCAPSRSSATRSITRGCLETLAYWASLATATTICWLIDIYDRIATRRDRR